MTTRSWILVIALAAAAAGCGGGGDDGDGAPAVDAPMIDAAIDAAPACGAADLCARTRGECMVNISEAQCLGFYDPATTTCEDIAGYTTCNCNCVEAPTCSEYFDCGSVCFEDWC